jgi:hypothetical protein
MILARGQLLGIGDDIAAMLNIQDKIHYARYRVRDEANRITWVYDCFLGLCADGVVR